MCAPLYSLVGQPLHLVIDEEGTIAEASGPGSDIAKQISSTQQHSRVGHLQQLEQTSRLLKFIPTLPVHPGDAWDASVYLGDLGQFTGKSTLDGYRGYEDHYCAVISTKGTLKMDLEMVLEMMANEFAAMGELSVDNFSMSQVLYWDDHEKLPRYSQVKQSMVMHMQNPLDGSLISIPVDQIITMTSAVKE
jgi:hypothetical protein